MAAPLTVLPDPPDPPTPVGLIAGGGRLPVMVARGMKEAGHEVCCLGIAGAYPAELREMSDRFREVGALRLGSWRRALQRFGVRHAVMVGRVDKASLMHDRFALLRHLPDLTTARLWITLRHDRRSHLILGAIADHLAKGGVHLIDSTAHIQPHMADAGVMTLRQPTIAQRGDVEWGWPMLQEILRLDIGQAIAVRDKDVVAVEAVEGTDRMIERVGGLVKAPGWVLLKGARSGHDRRSDVPTVGPQTVRNVHAAGGRCVAVAAGEVIMIDKPETLALADELGVAVVGVASV